MLSNWANSVVTQLTIEHQGIKNTRYDGAQILELQHGKCENRIVT